MRMIFAQRPLQKRPRSLKPVFGKLAYLCLDGGVVCAMSSVGEKSRRVTAIAGGDVLVRLRQKGLHIWSDRSCQAQPRGLLYC